jgi:hypothetical protein
MAREDLIKYAMWIESKRGLVYLANILVGDFSEFAPRRPGAVQQLTQFCNEKNIGAFPVVVTAEKLEQGISMVMQATAIGSIRPNLAVFGWSSIMELRQTYLQELQTATNLGMSLVLLEIKKIPNPEDPKRIDIWWRGQKNGGLMLLIAYLLSENWEWDNAKIRVLRVVENEAGQAPAEQALQEMIDLARVEAEPAVVIEDESFTRVLHSNSADATCVILGFEFPEKGKEAEWHANIRSFVDEMPTTILVNSAGGEGLFA